MGELTGEARGGTEEGRESPGTAPLITGASACSVVGSGVGEVGMFLGTRLRQQTRGCLAPP